MVKFLSFKGVFDNASFKIAQEHQENNGIGE